MKCVRCQHDLIGNSRYCAACGAYQDGRRFILEWSGLAAAVIALYPLYQAANALISLAAPPAAKISILETRCQAHVIQMFVENKGGRSAHVLSPSLIESRANKNTRLNLQPENGPYSTEIEAGQIVRIQLNFPSPQRLPQPSSNESCAVTMALDIIGSKDHESVEGSCKCPK